MNNAIYLCFQVKSSTTVFNLASFFNNKYQSLLKEEINIYEQENLCLKCSKINTNQNSSFNKPICNTCNVFGVFKLSF